MRVPSAEQYAKFFSGLGLFLGGIVVGAALFLSIYQHNFSLIAEENTRLEAEMQNMKTEVDTARKNKNKETYIGKINVIVEQPPGKSEAIDGAVLNELKSRVYKDLKVVSGKPVSSVKNAADVYANLVHRKIYRNIYDKDYIISVRRMFVIQTDFTLTISVEENIPNF